MPSSKKPTLVTELLPHQQRLLDKLQASNGLLAAWGVGSGKTLGSIAAAQQLGLPVDVITPASLQANFQKELDKHLDQPLDDVRIRSYEKAVRDKDVKQQALAILDEAHRIRNTGTLTNDEVAKRVQTARARLLLTGTPVFNQPSDVANLLNVAAGQQVLPSDPSSFKREFVGAKTIQPSFVNRLRGMKPMTVPELKNRSKLVDAATGYVDVHKGGGKDFPERIDEEYDVPMSAKQHEMYRWAENRLPWYLRVKIRAGLPMTKAESKDLNAFEGALRQTSNTPRPYVENMSDEEESQHTPKINKLVEHLNQMKAADPNHRGVVYSNYLAGGLDPLSRQLKKGKVPHAVLTGSTPTNERAQMVRDYNAGKTPVLLISSAGTEGLDLKGTKSVQLLDPHWHNSRAEQVIGRGIRYKSHEHLPPAERKVRVMRYYSSHPETLANKVGIGSAPKGIERYMQQSSNTKSQLGGQIMDALQEASDKGPLKKAPMNPKQAAFQEVCAFYGVKTAALSPTHAALLSALVGGTAAGGGAALGSDKPSLKTVGGAALGGALAGGATGYGVASHGAKALENAVRHARRLKLQDLAAVKIPT